MSDYTKDELIEMVIELNVLPKTIVAKMTTKELTQTLTNMGKYQPKVVMPEGYTEIEASMKKIGIMEGKDGIYLFVPFANTYYHKSKYGEGVHYVNNSFQTATASVFGKYGIKLMVRESYHEYKKDGIKK